MLKKFDEEISKIILETKNIIVESNGFQDSDELLEEIYDVKGYSNFDEFKKDSQLLEKIRLTDKLSETTRGEGGFGSTGCL